MNKLKIFLLLSSLLLVGCQNTSPSEISDSPISTSETPEEYVLEVDDIDLILGDSYIVKGKLSPTDFLWDVYLDELDNDGVVKIEDNIITGLKEGSATLIASAINITDSVVKFDTSTVFNVNVTPKSEELYSNCDLLYLSIDDNEIDVSSHSLVLDYYTYLSFVEHKDDISSLIDYKVSKYASIKATFTKEEEGFGYINIKVIAEDDLTFKDYRFDIENYYISNWLDIPLVNADFEYGYECYGWTLENFKTVNCTSNASSIDLSPLKDPATRVFSMYGNVTDEYQEASLYQYASIENVKAGDTIEVSCLISTSYGTRIKSIKLIGGNQKIEMKDMSTNWRAQIISQKFILTEEDIANGQVRIGLCFTAKDETSTSGGWMYLDDFHLEYLEKIYPKE